MENINIKRSSDHFLTEVFPSGNSSPDSLGRWIQSNREFVSQQLEEEGGLVFKGFNLQTAQDFEKLARMIDDKLADRHIFDGDVTCKRTPFVSDVASPDIKKILSPLSLHNEDSFVPEIPDKIMFCSLHTASWGGESLIADCRKVYEDLPQDLQKKYKRKKLKSTLVLEDRLFLANALIPKNVQTIIDFAKNHGARTVKRLSENMTEFTFTVPATIQDQRGRDVWFNTLHQAVFYNKCVDIWMAYKMRRGLFNKPFALMLIFASLLEDFKNFLKSGRSTLKMHDCTLMNGEKITPLERIKMGFAFWKNTAVLPLSNGDFFVLNNKLVAHGRMPYKGKRIMVSAMTEPGAL